MKIHHKMFRKVFLLIIVISTLLACKKEEPVDNASQSTSGGSTQDDGIVHNAVMDIDGHSYDAIIIGNKVWMIQNLKTTRYANGENIPMGSKDVFSDELPYRYAPNDDNSNVLKYGYLYNWPAVMHGENSSSSDPSGVQGICPYGWHVPSNAEWNQLVTIVGTKTEFQCDNNRNNIAKALASTSGWQECSKNCAVGNNQSMNNLTHFCVYPTGYGGEAVNSNFGRDAYFWSSTISYILGQERLVSDFELDYYSALTYTYSLRKRNALAVRCVRD